MLERIISLAELYRKETATLTLEGTGEIVSFSLIN
jgi:hypothetical protein